jgi:hypothetical protein
VGYDAGKKVKGRKLHALVDVEGLPLRVVVHSAGMQDRDGAGGVLRSRQTRRLSSFSGVGARTIHRRAARSVCKPAAPELKPRRRSCRS